MPRLPLILSALLLTSLPAFAQTCPAPLADAHKLVLVTARDMASTNATVQRFSRANPHAPWKPDGGPVSAIIGHNGMGWANAFRTFAKGDVCVDDPKSRAYNTITTRAKVGAKVHGENMWRVPDYVRGLVVDYPTDAHARAGSCIFIHAWLPGKTGTAGCVAVRTPVVMKLQEFTQGGAVLAVLPKQALDRFKGCLPE